MLSGRYRLVQRVGRGGMADVYREQDELLHRTVAIKHGGLQQRPDPGHHIGLRDDDTASQ